KALQAQLRTLRLILEELLTVSFARTKEGIAALAAERDLAAEELREAQQALARTEREAELARITAPIAGRVTRVAVKPGDRVEAGTMHATLLCTLARVNVVRATFEVDPGTVELFQALVRAGKIRLDKLAAVPVHLGLANETAFPHKGGLEIVAGRPVPKGKPGLGDALFPNAKETLTRAALAVAPKERQVRVRVTLGEPRPVRLVPPFVVGTDAKGKAFVLTVNAKNVVESRQVRLGP